MSEQVLWELAELDDWMMEVLSDTNVDQQHFHYHYCNRPHGAHTLTAQQIMDFVILLHEMQAKPAHRSSSEWTVQEEQRQKKFLSLINDLTSRIVLDLQIKHRIQVWQPEAHREAQPRIDARNHWCSIIQ